MNARYPDFSSWLWRNYDNTENIDLSNWIIEKEAIGCQFFIGTDSQQYSVTKKGRQKRICRFTTALAAYKMGHGGSVITHTDTTDFIDALRERLLLEAMRSLETAWYLSPLISVERIITIHLDVNEQLKYKSARYKDELVGLVVAQGFKATHKPNSWAASSVADAKC